MLGEIFLPLTVDEIARHNLITCNPEDSLLDVAKLMLKHNVGSVLVNEKGKIVGIITKNDLLRQIVAGKNLEKTRAGEVMSHPVASCNKTDTIEEALKKFQNYSRLAVKDENGNIVGIVKKKIAERFAQVSLAYDFVKRRIKTPRD